MAQEALSGLKVLDLGHHIAGPFCTKLLAGLGAETIKVENPNGGDPARKLPPFLEDRPHPERSGLFLYLNTNKRSVTLNLKSIAGVKILKKLIAWADILVENFSPRVMPSLGLDYNSLKQINSRLVLVSISNFGQTGPYKDYKATDIVEYALGGLMYMSGEPDREPLKHGGSQAQYQAGLYAFAASLSTAHAAAETGIGQHVDISIMEVINSIDEYGLISWEYEQKEFMRRGNLGAEHPWGLFMCKNGYVGIAATGRAWQRLVEMTGLSELADSKFATPQDRLNNRDELDAILLPWLLERTKEEIYHAGQAKGVPISIPRTVKELFDSPQYTSRGFWRNIDHPATGELAYPGATPVLSETPYQVERAPLLGEHNEQVYCGLLGYSKEDLVRFAGARVI